MPPPPGGAELFVDAGGGCCVGLAVVAATLPGHLGASRTASALPLTGATANGAGLAVPYGTRTLSRHATV